MNPRRSALALLVAVASFPTLVLGQQAVRVRGTIDSRDGQVLKVTSREGRPLVIRLAPDAAVAVARATRFEDIKPGDYVGTAAMRRPDGTLLALEVHYLPPNVPGGQTAWDLEPGSTMTNANVEATVAATGRRELTLRHKDGAERVIVPEAAPIVRAVPGVMGDLKPGEYIFATVQIAADGSMTTARIQVSKDGVRPPQ